MFKKLFSKKTPTDQPNKHDAKDKAITSKADRQISSKMAEKAQEKLNVLDILLLGAGGSGKSTVFKQMHKVFHGCVDEKEVDMQVAHVHECVLKDIIDLSKQNILLNMNDTTNKYKIETSELDEVCHKISEISNVLMDSGDAMKILKSLASDIDLLWNHDDNNALKNTWDILKKSHIMDNTPYFLNKIKTIVTDEYKVSFEDYVRLRRRTTGIIHKQFHVEAPNGAKYKFKITDVGGQRSERRKWLQLFSNVNVVLYIMNLAGYDQVLYEDNSKNCLSETLTLFETVSQNKAFNKTDFVLFFNKIDVFEAKIKSVPFTVFKSDFDENDARDSSKVQLYIKQEFKKIFEVKPKHERGQIYFHTTCACDEKQVGQIIRKVQIDVITSTMKKLAVLI